MDTKTRILLLVCLLIFFGSNIATASAWLYPDQPYRIPVTVNSPSVLTDYQILIDINAATLSGDANSQFWANTNTNGLDLRFSNQDDNQSLDYFREFFNKDANAHIWVEIKNLSSGDQNIFMYYGSSTTDDNSSFENTFIDDGNGTTILGWTLAKDSQNDWTSNGTQYINTSTSGLQQMYKAKTNTNALSYAVSVEMQGNGGTTEVNYFLFDQGNTNSTFIRYLSTTDKILFYPSGTDGPGPCTISITDTQLYDINVTRDYSGTWRIYANNNSCSIENTTDLSGIELGFWRGGNNTAIADNVFTKKTNSGGEPVYSFGSFEDQNVTTIRIVDEETILPVDANVTINGVVFDVNSNGYFDVNAFAISYPATIQVSHSSYDTRIFYFLSSAGLVADSIFPFGLRTASESSDITFQFFAPDESTVIPNQIIKVIRNGVLSGRNQTSATGNLTFNLAPQDPIYDFDILFSGQDTGTPQYSYDAVTVTVNAPRNEANNSVISSPSGFNLDVGGLGLQTISGQTSFPFSTILILGNTVDAYTLRVVDNNATLQQYFARNYIMQAKGDTSSITITPYLIDIDEGVLVNLLVVDQPTNTTVPDIRVTLSVGINNVLTVVEDTTTDSTGIAQLVMLSQKQYDLSITSPNQDINYLLGQISAASTTPTFFINFTSSDQNFTTNTIRVSFSPKTDTVSGTNQVFDVNVNVDFNFSSFLVQAIDNNTIIDSTASSSNPFNASLNVNLADFNSGQVIIRVTVIAPDQNSVINKSYIITSIGNGGLLNLVGLRENSSPNNLIIFAVIGLIGLVAVMGQGTSGNNDAQVFVGAVGMGLIAFLFFRDFFVFIVGAVFAGAIAWMWVRTQR